MNKKFKLLQVVLVLAMLSAIVACEKEDNGTKGGSGNIVSDFVYDGLSSYYYWNGYVGNKAPTKNDIDPVAYFDKVLHPTDKEHGWSWITDDVQALLDSFKGEPVSFGFSIAFTRDGNDEIFAVVKYVFPNTPASEKGIERGDLIGKINGASITNSNYALLYGSESVKLSIYKVEGSTIVKDRDEQIAPRKIETDPVLYSNVYEIDGHKIGYMFYTDFINEYNNRLYETFANFKSEGVTDLVIDLRNNHGGTVSSAIYLASLIVPTDEVRAESPFIIMSYNEYINTTFDKYYEEADAENKYKYDRKEYLGAYNSPFHDPLEANLNLNKVYIIATSDSYSASELTTFCLRQYVDVVHIGSPTGGKYSASWTVHGYDSEIGQPVYVAEKLPRNYKTTLKNWAMQPIVAIYANSNGDDFSAAGKLNPDIEEQEGFVDNWVPIGDTSDRLLSQAIYQITGNDEYKPEELRAKSAAASTLRSTQSTRFDDPNDFRKHSVIIDNPKIAIDKLR